MDVIPAVITGGAAILVATLGLVGALFGHLAKQIADLRTELHAEREDNRVMWNYCRRLLDLYYRHRRPNAPDPPRLPGEDD